MDARIARAGSGATRTTQNQLDHFRALGPQARAADKLERILAKRARRQAKRTIPGRAR